MNQQNCQEYFVDLSQSKTMLAWAALPQKLPCFFCVFSFLERHLGYLTIIYSTKLKLYYNRISTGTPIASEVE